MRLLVAILGLALLVPAAAAAKPRKGCAKSRACRGVATAAWAGLPAGLAGRLVLPAPGPAPGPGGGGAPPPPPPPTIPVDRTFTSVSAYDDNDPVLELIAAPGLVKAGKVRVEFDNAKAADPHNLFLEGNGQNKPLFGALDAGVKQTKEFTLTPGDYVLYCQITGHRAAGMWSALKVEA